MRKTTFGEVVDSGKREKHTSGSVRDTACGKGRFDLLSPFAEERLARHMENGARKYADRNWEQGMDFHRCLDSAKRHINAYLKCRLLGIDPPEDHLAAAVWNLEVIMHFEALIEAGVVSDELDDLPKGVQKQCKKKRT
jgi:hypothetical protein